MERAVILFLGPEDGENEEAYRMLEKVVGLKIELAADVARLVKYVPMPFLVEGTGARHYGLRSIRKFVDQQVERSNGARPARV